MAERPTGTVTFLFTDVEGSTRPWEEYPAEMRVALERHDEILRSAIEGGGGYVFSTAGDAFSAAFARAGEAVDAAKSSQQALGAAAWPADAHIEVRMGLHTGEAQERDGDYFGPALNRAARIMSAGHGGQILVSETTASVAGADGLVGLGEHRLKDLSVKEQLFQVGDRTFPALRSLEAVRHNLPVERTPLVGRKEAIDEIVDLVGDNRLVTLLGIGGTGKTRLATAAAAELADRFADGVWFVDLVPVVTEDEIVVAMATATGISVSGPDSLESFAASIADREMLLVVDNCEHVTDDAADVLDVLLELTTRPRIIATSREPLQLLDERQLHVAPLVIADDLGAPAVQLFTSTAERIGAQITLDEIPLVARICGQLDGLPLSLELAAAQLRHFTVVELADRLDQRFEILTRRRGGRKRRQASLQSILEDTWGMLNARESELLMQLAAFPAGFGADDVDAITAGFALGATAATLSGLVDRSLVARDGDGRHRVLETVKLFARGQWPQDDPGRYLEAHNQWVLNHLRAYSKQEWYTSHEMAAWANQHYDDRRAVEDRLVASARIAELAELFSMLTMTYFDQTGVRAAAVIDRVEQYLRDMTLEPHHAAALHLVAANAALPARIPDWFDRGSAYVIEHLNGAEEPEAVAAALIIASWMPAFSDLPHALALLDQAREMADAGGATRIGNVAEGYAAMHLAVNGELEQATTRLPELEDRLAGIPYDYGWQLFDSARFMTTVLQDPDEAVSTVDRRIAEVVRPDWVWQLLRAVALAATGDGPATRQALQETEETVRNFANDDGLPDLLVAPAILAWRHGRHQLAARWVTAIRRAPRPTQNFAITSAYRQIRDQVGLLDDNPLDAATIEDIYSEATDWLTTT